MVGVMLVEMLEEFLELILTMGPYYECVVTIVQPERVGQRVSWKSMVKSDEISDSSMKMLARTGDIEDPMEVPNVCS